MACRVLCGVSAEAAALITDLKLARAVIEALRSTSMKDLPTQSYQDYLARGPVTLP